MQNLTAHPLAQYLTDIEVDRSRRSRTAFRTTIRRFPLAGAVMVLMLGLLSGCAGQLARPTHYQVVVSPVFTNQSFEDIFDAMATWQALTPVTFDVRIGTTTGDATDTIYIHPGDPNGGLYGLTQTNCHTCQNFHADITLYPLSHAAMVQTVAHELGHAMMGPEHATTGVSVMYAEPSDAAPLPTKTDAARWQSER